MLVDQQIDISIVIGFKDWGLERLLLSVKALTGAFGNRQGEVIISDFGSANGPEIEKAVTAAGARYHRTETDGTWSRSRAVNAGYSVAKGKVLVATDADMLFSPDSMEIIAEAVLADPNTAVVLQCRDLPPTHSSEFFSDDPIDWTELEVVSQLRPRWGMGGMFAATRERVGLVGGYDNRMHTYGGEDLDFAQRVRRSGAPIIWIDNPRVRMYHIWHPPTINTVEKSAEATEAVAANRAILHTDSTWKRNQGNGEWTLPYSPSALTAVVHVQATDRLTAQVLKSLSQQSDVRCQIVVLHDGESMDSTLQSFVGIDNFSFVKSSSNFADDYNKILSACDTPLVILMNGDTILASNSLAQIMGNHSASVEALWAPVRSYSFENNEYVEAVIGDDNGKTICGPSTGHAAVVAFSTKIIRHLAIDGSSTAEITEALLNYIEASYGRILFVPLFLGFAAAPLPATSGSLLSRDWVRTARDYDLDSQWDIAPSELSIRYPDDLSEAMAMSRLAPPGTYQINAHLTLSNHAHLDEIRELLPTDAEWTLVEDSSGSLVSFEAHVPNVGELVLEQLKQFDVEIVEDSELLASARLAGALEPREISDILVRSLFAPNENDGHRVRGLYAIAYGTGDFPREMFDALESVDLVRGSDVRQEVSTKLEKRWIWSREHSDGLNDDALVNLFNMLSTSGIDVGIASPTRAEAFWSVIESSKVGEYN